MSFWKAIVAVPKGLSLCLSQKNVRKLCFWPWALGAFCYFGSLFGAYHLHPLLLARLVSEPSGIWSYILYGLAWIVVGVALLVATMLASMLIVVALSSVFQTAIAIQVLKHLGHSPPGDPEGLSGLASEVKRTIFTEAAKLLWLVPLLIAAFVLGMIPILTPLAICAAAWLLAYQFVDVVLDVYRYKSRERIKFAIKNCLLLCCFGLTLSACWAIPFLGIFLSPAATAGAAWLLSESKLLSLANES